MPDVQGEQQIFHHMNALDDDLRVPHGQGAETAAQAENDLEAANRWNFFGGAMPAVKDDG